MIAGTAGRAGRRTGIPDVSSTTTTSDGGGASGSPTVRVLVEQFEDLLVGGIGEVRSRDHRPGPSTEFVDLQSRQRNLEAQERFSLGCLRRPRACRPRSRCSSSSTASPSTATVPPILSEVTPGVDALGRLPSRVSDASEPGVAGRAIWSAPGSR